MSLLVAWGLLVGGSVKAQEAPSCGSPVHDIPSPLVGVWREFTLTDEGEVLEGELRSSFDAGGCAFLQTFSSVDGEFTFRSLAFVDATTGRWTERFVLSNGRTAVYEWVPDGDDILLRRLDDDGRERYRLRLTEIGSDGYLVIEEASHDGGVTWSQGERTRTRRVGPPG